MRIRYWIDGGGRTRNSRFCGVRNSYALQFLWQATHTMRIPFLPVLKPWMMPFSFIWSLFLTGSAFVSSQSTEANPNRLWDQNAWKKALSGHSRLSMNLSRQCCGKSDRPLLKARQVCPTMKFTSAIGQFPCTRLELPPGSTPFCIPDESDTPFVRQLQDT